MVELIKRDGIDLDWFNEIKLLGDMEFEHGELYKGIDLTTNLVSNMAYGTPLFLSLWPTRHPIEFDGELICSTLSYIKPSNIQATLLTPSNLNLSDLIN